MLGLVAVASGLNGLFVFLSIGLGGFIISGLLSERAMKSCRMTSVQATLTDAHQPFEVTFTMTNRSRWFTVYSMRGLFTLKPPTFRLIARDRDEVAGVRIARIAPLTTDTFRAFSRGMPRGEYRSVLAMQLTTFPFGILEKFKLSQVPAELLVAPALDQDLLKALRVRFKDKLSLEQARHDFFGHRAYVGRESMKDVDWKKSAARPAADWVVKNYRAEREDQLLRVRALLSAAATLPNEKAYEDFLSRIRTVLAALDEARRPWLLDLGAGSDIATLTQAQKMLAALPPFARRSELEGYGRSGSHRVASETLDVSPSGVEWLQDATASRETAP